MGSPDQLKKLQDNVNKRKDEVNKTREKYQVALQDINNYNAKYMEEMTNVFEECQRKEAQRLQEFKDILFAVQKCLNISEDPEMPKNWPQFEEYTGSSQYKSNGDSKHRNGGTKSN